MSLTAAAAAVSAALDGTAAVHEGPPPVLAPPCIVLLPGDPWLSASDGTVGLDVHCIVRTTSGRASALRRLGDLVGDARDRLAAAGYSPGDVRPGTDEPEAGILTAIFDIRHRDC